MSIRKTRFGLFLSDTEVYDAFPIWKDSATLDIEQEQDEVFYRSKVTETFTFVRDDYQRIFDAPFETRFRLVMEDNRNPGATLWQGYFYKTDCTFDEDNRTVEVKPNTIDNYDDIVARKGVRYNLIDLAPDRETVKYVKQPIIQLYIPGSNFVTNFLDGVWWEQPVIEPVVDTVFALPGDYKFGFDSIPNTVKNIVPNNLLNPLVPDVSGEYIQDGNGGTERVDGHYGFVLQNIGNGGTQWTIVDRFNGNNVVYTAPVGETFLNGGWGSFDGSLIQGALLESTTSSSQCRLFTGYVYGRYLTDELVVDGVNTFEIPESDIVADSFGYSRVLPLEVNTVIPFDGFSEEATRFGKAVDDAANNAGLYFTAPSAPGGERVYPLVNSEWQEASFWFYYTPVLRQLQENGSREIFLRHAYPLASAIKVMLREIAPGIRYEETEAYSEFLNKTSTNPVSGEKYVRLFITPKTNIKVGDYDKPAEKAMINFAELMEVLRVTYDLYWHVDLQRNFRIEHISWYENGGSYDEPVVGVDLTEYLEPKNQKPWDYKSNVYSYDKANMPERFTFAWMDSDASVPFDGHDIVVESPFVQKGSTKDLRANVFSTDIGFIQAHPDRIDNDGFVLIACQQDVYGKWYVPFVEMEVNEDQYKVMNGHVAFAYLHPRYRRHNLPGSDITVNNMPDEALSLQRVRNQELTFPFDSGTDPMELVKTQLGDGKLKSASVNIVSRSAKAEIRHDG